LQASNSAQSGFLKVDSSASLGGGSSLLPQDQISYDEGLRQGGETRASYLTFLGGNSLAGSDPRPESHQLPHQLSSVRIPATKIRMLQKEAPEFNCFDLHRSFVLSGSFAYNCFSFSLSPMVIAGIYHHQQQPAQ
jgi:hypothetical protein